MDEQQVESLLLTAEEQAGLAQIAGGEAPYSQRAQALLALGAGAPLAEAADRSGLTQNQVKLWRGRFRNSRLAIFPAQLPVAEATAVPPAPAAEPAPTAAPQKKQKDKKAKKEKKAKKAKKEKKKKKDKKKKKKDNRRKSKKK